MKKLFLFLLLGIVLSSFVIAENIALNATVANSSAYNEVLYPASNTNDGDYGTAWVGANGQDYYWLKYDLKGTKTFNSTGIYLTDGGGAFDFFPVNFSIWVSEDDVTYIKVNETTGWTPGCTLCSVNYNMTFEAGNIDYRYVLFNVTAWNDSRIEIEEFEIIGFNTTYLSNDVRATLNSPVDSVTLASLPINFNASFDASLYTLTNATLYLWNSTSLVNSSVIKTISGTEDNDNFLIYDLDLGSYDWNVYACGDNATGSLCKFALSNRSFDYTINVINLSYPGNTLETARNRFEVQINVSGITDVTLANLIYNGTAYAISNITTLGDTVLLERYIDIPLNPVSTSDTKNHFYFNFTFSGGGTAQTSEYEQNVSYIYFKQCDDVYSLTSVNFTFTDEFTGERLNASTNLTDIRATFSYWLGSGVINKTYSFQNLSSTLSQYQFCLYPNYTSLITNLDMEYEADNYVQREYYFRNATLTNITNEINLVNLLSEYSVKFFVTVKSGLDAFSNGKVTISKYFPGEGVYKNIGIRATDVGGEFIEYFELDKQYKFTIDRGGISYGTLNKWLTCEASPCTLVLNIQEAETDYWSGYYDTFATNVMYSLVYDDETKVVTYTFTDLTGLAHYFRLIVYELNFNDTGTNLCEGYLYSTSGSLTCNMTGYEGHFSAYGYISRSPEKIVKYITFVINTIKDTLGQLGIFVTLMLVLTVALAGAWNPVVGIVLTLLVVVLMPILGFSAFSFFTVSCIVVLGIIIIIKMRD